MVIISCWSRSTTDWGGFQSPSILRRRVTLAKQPLRRCCILANGISWSSRLAPTWSPRTPICQPVCSLPRCCTTGRMGRGDPTWDPARKFLCQKQSLFRRCPLLPNSFRVWSASFLAMGGLGPNLNPEKYTKNKVSTLVTCACPETSSRIAFRHPSAGSSC